MNIASKVRVSSIYSALICTLSLSVVEQSAAIEANNINTATIMSSTASPSCADWSVVGTCFWLKCTYWKCSVKTSVKVHHFIPEMVISAYNHDNQSPWAEMKWLNQGAKGGMNNRLNQKYTQYRFKNAEAIGHPGGMAMQMIGSLGYSCESQTTPYMPYFLSALDYLAWNNNMPEMFYPEALAPNMRNVGTTTDIWGNLYPRSGSITQTHDYKASAVIAQRVGDIVSRTGQLHVYYPVQKSGGKGKWYPKEVIEGDKKTHRWQLLSPKMEQSCKVFPHSGDWATHSDSFSNTENYSWALWRPYSCCKKQGQVFLGHVDWKSTHTH
ncbi:TPA: TIGR03756 family integrating conjugative element protein [Mannheimia haemolytica]|uniref:TIGR03756 family integrating conjugative element protein n=1 Tax=Mannheimia haemolytica TaxID=75985 RepID=UPI000DA29239|nr:TIGR03756 family integrating conjugative element protein [Mannheimia haemolytica]MCB4228081.1 TIGR03756 family integrating conjugative element protein [Mannheimia haemolytica]MEE3732246.1 TIGR03756 family integrating conjugative element protein [Mannheimia haemolytica]UQX68802.1 TIGR03756 family integrating conjugative element protein [Mannheimia haemolytica]SQE31400.1 integrating conjugative element protein, PFL_4710 family [Mannheimia haemolytica]